MASDLQPGSSFASYTLERRLGGGGFGDVWLAHDAAGHRVAIKLLLGDFAGSDSARLRTDIELLAAAAVKDCPNVVQVLAGGTEPAPHVVMEYIEGTDLQREIARRGPLPMEEALRIARGMAEALAALERARIVHRDIKPANVMLDRDGVIKLADFGIAKIAGIDSTHSRSQVPLTFAYAAPEAWSGEASHLSDLYSFGAVVFQCLAGRPPFVGDPMSIFQQQISAVPDPTLLPAATPASLLSLVTRCLAKAPTDRPQSAAEALDLLNAAERELQRGAHATLRLPAAFGPWLRRSPHPTQPWSFLCEHETTGQPATVEMHFSDSFEYGDLLRRAVEVNPNLVPLGAERLFGTSRLILRPGESWPAPPPGEFQFWVARDEEAPPTTFASVSIDALGRAAAALQTLLDAAVAQDLRLNIAAKSLALLPDGRVRLSRPGLPPFDREQIQAQAMSWLRALALTASARAILDKEGSLADVARKCAPAAEPDTDKPRTPSKPATPFARGKENGSARADPTIRRPAIPPGKSARPPRSLIIASVAVIIIIGTMVWFLRGSGTSSSSLDGTSSSAGGIAGTDQATAVKLANTYFLTFLGLLTESKQPQDLINLFTPECQAKVRPSDLSATVLPLQSPALRAGKGKIDDVDLGKVDVQKTSDGFMVSEPNTNDIKVKTDGRFLSLSDYGKQIGLNTTSEGVAQPVSMQVRDGRTYLSDCGGLTQFLLNSTPSALIQPTSGPSNTSTNTTPIVNAGNNATSVSSDDRFIISKYNINAPLSYHVVGPDGQMPNPDGEDDVAYYDFSAWPGHGGAPGKGGNAVFAGHVDSGFKPCHNGTVPPPCESIFWDLIKVKVGDEIDIRFGGTTYKYQVTKNQLVEEVGGPWDTIVSSTAEETITVISTGGDYNPSTRTYSSRTVIEASRVSG